MILNIIAILSCYTANIYIDFIRSYLHYKIVGLDLYSVAVRSAYSRMFSILLLGLRLLV